MYSKLSKGIAWLLTALFFQFYSVSASAQQQTANHKFTSSEHNFLAKPANCVALRQGRTCYAKVSLLWQSASRGNFCLYQKLDSKVVQCWRNSRGSNVEFDFQSSESIAYQLIAIDSNTVVAETSIDVSWVHKATPRKRRWRLF